MACWYSLMKKLRSLIILLFRFFWPPNPEGRRTWSSTDLWGKGRPKDGIDQLDKYELYHIHSLFRWIWLFQIELYSYLDITLILFLLTYFSSHNNIELCNVPICHLFLIINSKQYYSIPLTLWGLLDSSYHNSIN